MQQLCHFGYAEWAIHIDFCRKERHTYFTGKKTPMSQTLPVDSHERARVMTMAVVRAAERLGLSGRDLAAILGLPEPTVSRMRKDEFRLEEGSKAFELGALFVRLFRSLDAIMAVTARLPMSGCVMRTVRLAVVHSIRSRRFPD